MSERSKESKLLHIRPSEIEPNKENPRLLFDPEELGFLKKSIQEVGILVPLTVFQRSRDKKFVLLDGERRWRCAKELNLKTVPCNQIEEPDQLENILRMFNIHNTREEWELIPTALKLQTLMRLLGDKSNTELAKFTGMRPIRVAECRRILTYPKRFLDLALVHEKERRITGDFFSQLYLFLEEVKKYPELDRSFTRDEITEIMIEKYREGTLPGILDIRILKNALSHARKQNVSQEHVVAATKSFLRPEMSTRSKTAEERSHKETATHQLGRTASPSMSPEEFYQAATGSTLEIESIQKSANKLKESLVELDQKVARQNPTFVRALKELRNAIDRILGT